MQVSWSRLKVVELRTPIPVEGVRVIYLEANHCPGAAMILFEVPGKRPLLHSGDCRLDAFSPLLTLFAIYALI